MKYKFLTLIPARKGSKRLPNKNILELNGKPLIQWTIEAAKDSIYLQDIFVTSDSDEILEIAKKNGVQLIKRPKELALDTSTTFEAIKHALKSINKNFDFLVLLQPTSPLRNTKHINEAIEFLFNKKECLGVVSVSKLEHSPIWSNTLPDDKNMENFIKKEFISVRSQDLDSFYRINGAIYIFKIKEILKQNEFFYNKNVFAYEMKKTDSIDIDELIDFKLAEVLL